MMKDKVTDLTQKRQEKRQQKGWSIEEIKKRAEQERAAYKKLSEKEPDCLASGGDMKKILEEAENEEKDHPTNDGK